MNQGKKLKEIALERGREVQNRTSGFIHTNGMISLFDNLCFALLLIQSKVVDNVLEGHDIVRKLMAFQGENGCFPRHLHEYPTSASIHHQVLIHHALCALGTKYEKEKNALYSAIQESQDMLHPVMHALFTQNADYVPQDAREWSTYLLLDAPKHMPHWNNALSVPVLPKQQLVFAESSPIPTYVDLFLFAYYDTLPQRIFSMQTSDLLYAAFLPEHFGELFVKETDDRWVGNTLFCGEGEMLFPLTFVSKHAVSKSGDLLSFTIDEPHPVQLDDIECQLFFPRKGASFSVNSGKKSTFTFGESLTFSYPYGTVTLSFSLEEGDGDFMGHVAYGNRPGMQLEDKTFDAHDYVVTIRSMRRSPKAVFSVQSNIVAHLVV